MVAAGRMRRGSAASVCRSFATGCCASTPADRTGWSMGSHRAHPRSSTPITAAHWRRLLRPARSRRSTASCAGRSQGPGAVALGDVRHLARRDHGRARVEGARLRQDLGAAAPLRAKRAGRRGFKKNFPAELAKIRARLPKGVEIELWWQDEARIGQKNKLTRRWARRGTRPRAPRDQRTEWAYIFGAICPAKGKGAGLVMPWCDTDAMAAHLIEISAAVDPGFPCGADRRSGRLALDAQAGDPRQHHRPGAAATIARVEPGGECLAIHARQLVDRTGSSNPTKTSSRCAAKPGTTSSTNHGRSCPSACANGRMGSDQ